MAKTTEWTVTRAKARIGAFDFEAWQLPNGQFTARVARVLDGAVVFEMGEGPSDGVSTMANAQAWALLKAAQAGGKRS